MELDKFIQLLYDVCDKETCAERFRKYYTDDNKFLGHCSVVSYIINKRYGGTIKQVYVPEYDTLHYLNFIDGKDVDPTKVQFKKLVTYKFRGEISAQDLKARPGVGPRVDILEKRLEELGV